MSRRRGRPLGEGRRSPTVRAQKIPGQIVRGQTGRAPAATAPVDIYLGNPAHEDLLGLELEALRKGARTDVVAPGAVAAPTGALVDPAFARQVLPRARLVEGKSASALALRALDGVSGKVARLDVLVPELHRRGSRAPERHPLQPSADHLRDELRPKIEGRGLADDRGQILQVLLVDGWRAWVSEAPRSDAPALLSWPAAFPGGRAPIELDRYAPSTAYMKLEEALRWLDREPGEGDLVLDLGAAPGGWSWSAVKRGARVVAVDRADLHPSLADHPRLRHDRKDAFSYVPDEKPTWLVCDVIALPERSLKLVEDAIASPRLQALIVTIKLKKPYDLAAIARARALARGRVGFWGRAKNLVHNKLELTLMMRRAPAVDAR